MIPGGRIAAGPRLRRARRLAALAALGACVCAPTVASGHRPPGGRSLVAQIEPCELVLLISWVPTGGDETDALLAHAARGAAGPVAAAPGERLRALYAARALAPLSIRADGQALAARSLDVKLVHDPPRSARVAAVALVSYSLPPGTRRVEIANSDSHRTRFSWVDRSHGRFTSPGTPTARWTTGVASILLLSRAGDPWPSCHDAPH